jgi:predicted enzyme related to lactoylglutathione lyase
MRDPFVHEVGGVLSADIAVPDHQRELDFYSKVLTTGTVPFWRHDLSNNLGAPVIGLGARTSEYESLPLQWMPHFQVADIASSVSRAIESGGSEIMHGKDDNGQSQWAVLADEDGAAFGLIPVVHGNSESPTSSNCVGRISWLSLSVPDARKSQDFYQKVIGWKPFVESGFEESGFEDFEMRLASGNAAASICQSRSESPHIPSVWLMHLPVGDLSESLKRVKENGGQVVAEDFASGTAVVRDPVGVFFAFQAG